MTILALTLLADAEPPWGWMGLAALVTGVGGFIINYLNTRSRRKLAEQKEGQRLDQDRRRGTIEEWKELLDRTVEQLERTIEAREEDRQKIHDQADHLQLLTNKMTACDIDRRNLRKHAKTQDEVINSLMEILKQHGIPINLRPLVGPAAIDPDGEGRT